MPTIKPKTFYKKPNGKFIYVSSVKSSIFEGKKCWKIETIGEVSDAGNANELEPFGIEEILGLLNGEWQLKNKE